MRLFNDQDHTSHDEKRKTESARKRVANENEIENLSREPVTRERDRTKAN